MSEVQIPKTKIKEWTKALRSGDYPQGRMALQNEQGYCCHGVACDLFLKEPRRDGLNFLEGVIPEDQESAPVWLNKVNRDFSYKTGKLLSELNDESFCNREVDLGPFTFDEIADVLELVYLEGALDD